MNDKLQSIFKQALIALGPYIILGIIITCAIALLILSYYVLLWGVLIGFVLWTFALLRRQFSSTQNINKNNKGRVIDHDNNK